MTVAVSVLTPSFGYGQFIADAIESVRAQVDVSVEHIIQDGGSTDDTIDVLERYERIASVYIENDDGQSDALNKALGRAQGSWIAWLNADEFYLPGALLHLFRTAELSGADVVYGDTAFVDEHGCLLRLVPQHRFHQKVLEWYGPYIQSCSLLMRRSVLPLRPWDPDMRRVMDWELYLRLARNGARIVHLERPVGAFRVHPGQVTATAAAPDLADYELVRSRHGVDSNASSLRAMGRMMHMGLKLQAGSYARELRARRLHGADLRWFCADHTSGTAIDLVERCSRS